MIKFNPYTIIIWLIGMIITVLLVYQVKSKLEDSEYKQFQYQSSIITNKINTNFISIEQTIFSIVNFMGASSIEYGDDFRLCLEPYLYKESPISLISYIEKVKLSDKIQF